MINRKKWFSPLFVVFLAVAGIFSISSYVSNKQAEETPVVEKTEAANHTYYVAGLDQSPSWSPNSYQMFDSDGDGIFTYNYTMPAGNTFFCICEDGGWTTTYRFDNLLIQHQSGTSWSEGGDKNIGIYNASSLAITICFRESDKAVMVFPQGSVPTSWKTFYVVVTSGWDDWKTPRINFWNDNWKIVWNASGNHCPSMTDLSKTYTGGGQTGSLYSVTIPSSTAYVQVTKPNPNDGKTNNLSISSGTIDGASLYYDSDNKLSGFTYIADGGYIRGKYHGVVNWDTNIVLSDDKVDEYVSYDYGTNEFSARLELYAGDYFKFYQFYEGVQYVRAIYSVTSSDNTYYPWTWQDNNVKVTNAGIYNVSAGQGTGSESENEWYYLGNTASGFAYEFINSMTCDPSGASAPTWKTIPGKSDTYSWEYFSDYYTDHLDDYAKDTFYRAVSNKDGTDIENAVARYQVLIANHGYTPFMRNSSNVLRSAPSGIGSFKPLELFGEGEDNFSTIIIIIASSVSLLSITALSVLVIKKRKTKEE